MKVLKLEKKEKNSLKRWSNITSFNKTSIHLTKIDFLFTFIKKNNFYKFILGNNYVQEYNDSYYFYLHDNDF